MNFDNKLIYLQPYTKVMKTIIRSRRKDYFTVIVIATVLLTLQSFGMIMAQDKNKQLSQIIPSAFQSGDASKLANYFNASIDLALMNYEGTYSKKQAEQILKTFFENYPVKSFTLEHTGNSNDGSSYLIGLHKTTNNKSFRVYILFKKENNVELIQQLQFEEE